MIKDVTLVKKTTKKGVKYGLVPTGTPISIFNNSRLDTVVGFASRQDLTIVNLEEFLKNEK